MGNAGGTDIAGRAVADPVVGPEVVADIGPAAMAVVAEAQAGAAVVLRFEHEVAVLGLAVQQVALHAPVVRAALRTAFQAQGG